MHLAIVTTALGKGGSERVVLKIAKHFDAKIYCPFYDPAATFEGFSGLDVETPRLPMTISNLTSAAYFMNLRIKDHDVVNVHYPPSELARNRNSPVLWYCYTPYRPAFDLHDWHAGRVGPVGRMLFKAKMHAFRAINMPLASKIEYIFVNSALVQERVKRYLGRDSEVLYAGIDARLFSCRDHERFFFYPSRLCPEKDFGYAIEAFKLFSARNPGWKLVIAGSSHDRADAYIRSLKAMAGGDSILIEKDISDESLHDFYSRCYATLYSPVNEDFGYVPLEGMASSKPCIARNEGGPRETVSDGKDGFLVNSPHEMAHRMEALARDPELCQRMGKAGRKKVVERFGWELFLKRFGEKARELADKS